VSKRIVLLFLAAAAACSSDKNALPSFVVSGSVVTTVYDGGSDDLLTAGLGAAGLGQVTPVSSTPAPPGFADPANPTAAELRKRAIYVNYRALVDPTFNGGYSTLYGPNVQADGGITVGSGMIPGEEWLAYDDDGTGRVNVTMMVQVPDSFDPSNPCIVTGASSGSRGVYGAIATAGEWGLKHGCAVAYTDKGSGMGVDDVQNNAVNLMDGTRDDAADAGTKSNFTANLSDADRTAFNTATPDRFAVKHAHSQQNPERDWGKYTLHAIEFAYYVLNQKFGLAAADAGPNVERERKYHAGQILTIAASVSNGAGSSLAAVEQDSQHWISGVVAGEPQVQVQSTSAIQRGGTAVAANGKPLYDYMTLAALYQGCAAGASVYSGTNMNPAAGGVPSTQISNRCAVLQADGLLNASTAPAALPDEALSKLHEAGYEADSDLLHATHFGTYATPAVALTYANAYARASVKDNLCDYSFAFVDGTGVPTAVTGSSAATAALATVFGYGNGVPPLGAFNSSAGASTGIVIINNRSGAPPGTPVQDQLSQSATAVTLGLTGTDFNTDGMACLRNLFTGKDKAGVALTGTLLSQSNALKSGVQEVLRTGRVHGIPIILVQGRSDALVPINHASRAYYGANKMAEGANSAVVYYEVTSAQHFDSFIGTFQGYQTRFIPLHRYVIESLDFMFEHLRSGTPIPPSQVVRTTPRTSSNSLVTKQNVPDIPAAPAAADQITFSNGTLNVPD
jgi:hydroxybutyrate-dimer hydrolase